MISDAALHEAGHCVAAVRHGIGVHRVSIEECEIEPPGDYLAQGRHHGSLAVAYGIVALAGQAAAPKTCMSKLDRVLLANAFFLASFADSRDEMRRAFSILAEDFVFNHYEEIEMLAKVLDRRRNMTGAEVAEVLGGAEQ